jgi:glycosyltransferase involved in cell wall biosynthesis
VASGEETADVMTVEARMISVLILTYNEEMNLPSCLESVSWSDDIVVFDSFSTDRTVEIAKSYGARVVQRAWDNERNQRAESLKVGFKYQWVYNPDADEVTPPRLRDEMLKVVSDPRRGEVAYRVRFRLMFMGKWIKNSSLYPTWVVRLFQPAKLSFQRDINLRYVIDGPQGQLKSHFDHYSFGKGITSWWSKHNTYSSLEAREAIKALSSGKPDWWGLFSKENVRRRAALKDLSFRIPLRSFWIFLYLLVVRRGVLDGPPGWAYCRMRADYEFMIEAKIKELQRQQRGEEPG